MGVAQPGRPLTPEEAKREIDNRQGGPIAPNPRDPGFANTGGIDPKGKVRVALRDIPIIGTLTTWTPAQIRNALSTHMYGYFELSGQLVDQIIADDRVTATLNSRLTGLFGRDVRFEAAGGKAKGSRAAKEALDAWQEYAWPSLTADGALYQIGAYQNLFGFWPAQIRWDTSAPVWTPSLSPWHARYTYYNWDVRKYIALTQDGQTPIYPGDGRWFLMAPRGEYRAWVWGTIRPVAIPWLGRQYALRDMQNFSEIYGAPTRIGWTPAAADPAERDQFQAQLSQLGANTTLLLPRGVDKDLGYGYELISVGAADWSVFAGVADRCDMHITLAILMQNLTTEVKGGSFAATESHMDVRQGGIETDNQAWKPAIQRQVARPFASYNFGDPDLAPLTFWDVTSRDEQSARAQKLYSLGQTTQIFRQGGVKFSNPKEFGEFALNELGLKLPEMDFVEPDNGAGTGASDAATEADSKTIKGDK